jgi:hypothetical protein
LHSRRSETGAARPSIFIVVSSTVTFGILRMRHTAKVGGKYKYPMHLPEISRQVRFVFNGDADGIISQHIAGLSGVRPDERITGLKREIALLQRVSGDGDQDVYVFDINLDTNRAALERLLKNPGARIFWYDHHEPGPVPSHPQLKTRIQNTRGTCTALLTHAAFPGADPRWAAMGAYGDNLPQAAEALLARLSLGPGEQETLRECGELINYNSHGESPSDVLFPPLQVAEVMAAYSDPLVFLAQSGLIDPLRRQMRDDETRLTGLRPERAPEGKSGGAQLFRFPDEPWARRLGSTFASRLALAEPGRAVATLQPLQDGSWQVSIRAPRGRPEAPEAATLALEFPTGGGRALAAGINHLPDGQVDAFTRRFFDLYG